MPLLISSAHTYDRHQVFVNIGGVPDLDASYSPRVLVPQRVELIYVASDSGVWELHRATVSGPVRLKSGRVGMSPTRATWHSAEGTPAWLSQLIGRFCPADPVLQAVHHPPAAPGSD